MTASRDDRADASPTRAVSRWLMDDREESVRTGRFSPLEWHLARG